MFCHYQQDILLLPIGINTQILVNQSSTFFQQLFNKYFIRLDDKPYVYMMR